MQVLKASPTLAFVKRGAGARVKHFTPLPSNGMASMETPRSAPR